MVSMKVVSEKLAVIGATIKDLQKEHTDADKLLSRKKCSVDFAIFFLGSGVTVNDDFGVMNLKQTPHSLKPLQQYYYCPYICS